MCSPIIGSVSLYDMFYYFFIYSFCGWITEVAYSALKKGKFVNRGFLNGPVCPIYGFGVAVLVLLLNPLKESWWLLFLAGAVFCSLLEFFTGFVLDKIFKTKWWDYSNEKLNFKGYVCLRFSVMWGLAVVLVFYTLVPLTDTLIRFLPQKLGLFLLALFGAIMLIDFITVLMTLRGLRRDLKEVERITKALRKNSDAVGEKIYDITITVHARIEYLTKKIKRSRLGKAFPLLSKKHENALSDISEQLKEENKTDKSEEENN